MAEKNPAHLQRNTIAGVFGNILEWYDFAVFGFLAPVISVLFFPDEDPLAGLIMIYGIFATGYMMRPLGGIIFGHIGDRMGRKVALRLSIFLMAIPTVLVGFLPTHDDIGLTAAVLLVVLRLMQGLSVGGELIGSISFLVEIAPAKKRGLFGSWTLFGAVGGLLLGSAGVMLLTNILGHEAMLKWGWRIPFWSGIIILTVGAVLRRGMIESPEFLQAQKEQSHENSPLRQVLREMPGRVLQLAAIVTLATTSFYLIFVWMPTYLSKMVNPPIGHTLFINTVAMLLVLVIIPLSGRLSDRYGRREVMLLCSAAMGLLVYPLFLLIDQGTFAAALCAQLIFAVISGGIQGPMPALMVEMFPTHLRSSAIGLGYNLSVALLGGTAPMICTWMVRETGSITSPALYILFFAIISSIALYMLTIEKTVECH